LPAVEDDVQAASPAASSAGAITAAARRRKFEPRDREADALRECDRGRRPLG
jgi:hypothetical protein